MSLDGRYVATSLDVRYVLISLDVLYVPISLDVRYVSIFTVGADSNQSIPRIHISLFTVYNSRLIDNNHVIILFRLRNLPISQLKMSCMSKLFSDLTQCKEVTYLISYMACPNLTYNQHNKNSWIEPIPLDLWYIEILFYIFFLIQGM